MEPYTLIRATFVHTPTLEGGLEILVDLLVGVDSRGTIDFIGQGSQADGLVQQHASNPHFQYLDYSDSNKFICPGFIDTHIHASQYPNVGIGLGLPLLEWLKEYTFSLENAFTTHNNDHMKLAQDVYTRVISKTLLCGTTCASYFTTTDAETTKLFASLLHEHGQRGFVGKVCMDHNEPYPEYQESEEECVHSMKQVINHCKQYNDFIKPIVTPRFAPVCSRKLLKTLGRISHDEHLPIQTHISENHDEIQLVRDLFPECDSYAAVYDDHDLLKQHTILAHAIHLSEDECKLIKQKRCSISHCPTSNTFISLGEAPIKKYLFQDKINVTLGTDLSGGFEQSILGVLKHSILVSHHYSMKLQNPADRLSIADAFYMATQAGAIAVGLDDVVGTFAKGKKFDAQLIDLGVGHSNVDVFSWQLPAKEDDVATRTKKVTNLINKWVFSGDDRNTVRVWCDGKQVVNKLDNWVYVAA